MPLGGIRLRKFAGLAISNLNSLCNVLFVSTMYELVNNFKCDSSAP